MEGYVLFDGDCVVDTGIDPNCRVYEEGTCV